MKNLLAMLLGFLFLRVGDDTATGGDDTVAAAGGEDDVQGDLLAAVDDAPPVGDDTVAAPAKDDAALDDARRMAQSERERADRIERDYQARLNSQRQQDEDARRRAEEDKFLADPNADANEKWRIQANRRIHQTELTAQQTAFQSADANDRSSFNILCSQNKRFAYVKDEVEAELGKARAQGQNPSREGLAYFLLGRKVATAKPKSASKPAAKPGPRGGATGGIRSDVGARGAQTEREKRRARLEGQII